MKITYDKITYGDNWTVLNLIIFNYVDDDDPLIAIYHRYSDELHVIDKELEEKAKIKDVTYLPPDGDEEWEPWSFQFTTISPIDTDWIQLRVSEIRYILSNLPY